ncbi:MAG: hypothetical protein ABS98_17035 [Lysobacteraceae bacterium SCN 69-48]|nr:MAG: hypothetical protein ABS98_17035 [Xanthomonadaceae bacterium SCN 69-48]
MSGLHAQLHALAAHVRDPATHPGPPGIEDRRLAVYRELVASNLDGLLAGTFPVIRRTLGDVEWQALLRRFLRLGLEFIAFLESAEDPVRPWLAELAHYEWAELGLQLDDAALPAHDPDGDLLGGVPLVSPLAWPLAYRWPVHRLGPDCQPTEPPPAPTLVLLRRDPGGRVHFSMLSPLLYRLLALVSANEGRSGRALLRQLAEEAGHPDFDAFLGEALPMLERLRDEGVLLGTAPPAR